MPSFFWKFIAASLACGALELGLGVVGNQSVDIGIEIAAGAVMDLL